MSVSLGSTKTSDSGIETDIRPIDFNFRALKIRVFKNGDEIDEGHNILVTRRQFKHWISFLDHLSQKLDMSTPVHKLFRIDGMQILQFEDLENGGWYVAVCAGPFIACGYGHSTKKGSPEKSWNFGTKSRPEKPNYLDSAESVELYLKNQGYGTLTGLPYPLDGIKISKPSPDFLQSSQAPSPQLSPTPTRSSGNSKEPVMRNWTVYRTPVNITVHQRRSSYEPKSDTSRRKKSVHIFDPDLSHFDFYFKRL